MEGINHVFDKLDKDFEKALQEKSNIAFSNLSVTIGDLDVILREHVQDLTKGRIKAIVGKLQTKKPLSQEEINDVELWLVGDAEYYAKLENNFPNWIQELGRLKSELTSLQASSPDVIASSKARGHLLDARRVVADALFFIDQKERMERFKAASQELDDEERKILVRLLNQKLDSIEF